MSLWQWSTTPASNATAGAINWAEGQAPSTVNDSARQMMADVAAWFQSPEWLNYGLTPTYLNSTQFSLAGNQTALYSVGRRVQAFVTAGAVYGTISTSAFTSLTTVTVAWDSGSLDSGLSEVDVGIINPAAPSLSNLKTLTLNPGSAAITSLNIRAASCPAGAEIYLLGNGSTTPSKTVRAIAGSFQILNDAASSACMNLDDAGNATFTGIVSGSNLTGTSDERLKTDWKPLGDDFLDRVAAVRFGTYTRKDTGERRVGAGAQSLQKVLPEAVFGDDVLSVAEGSAALAIALELTREVLRLRALLEPVK